MWKFLREAIFPSNSDASWTWRRRMAFGGAAINLSGILAATWAGFDPAHASMVMSASQTGFVATMGIYVGLATVDDNLKRKNPAQPGDPQLSQ